MDRRSELVSMRASLDGPRDGEGSATSDVVATLRDIMSMIELCHGRLMRLERIEAARELALMQERRMAREEDLPSGGSVERRQ